METYKNAINVILHSFVKWFNMYGSCESCSLKTTILIYLTNLLAFSKIKMWQYFLQILNVANWQTYVVSTFKYNTYIPNNAVYIYKRMKVTFFCYQMLSSMCTFADTSVYEKKQRGK